MNKKEALEYWEWVYKTTKDYFDPHWEENEKHKHEEYVQAIEWAIKALKGNE